MNGIIVRIISNLYTVKCGNELYGCRARGFFRNKKISPMVGDIVTIDPENNIIVEIKERKNELQRPVVANIDFAFVVTSVKEPNLDLNLLDKLLTITYLRDIEPVICFTKTDLLNAKEAEMIQNIKKYYEMIGYKAVLNTELDKIKKIISNKTVVLAGQSGAGKSSLINNLDTSLELKTDQISMALGRGKHTTRHVELFQIGDGFVVDTPGFSCIDLKVLSKNQIKEAFLEFNDYSCRFRDCMHNKEIGCGVKEAVLKKRILESRYDNYLRFIKGE